MRQNRPPARTISTSQKTSRFCWGQHADQANNKLILKRSMEGGRTWGAPQIIADDGANTRNSTGPFRVFSVFRGSPLRLIREHRITSTPGAAAGDLWKRLP